MSDSSGSLSTHFHKARKLHDSFVQHLRAVGNLLQQRETLMGLATSLRKEGPLGASSRGAAAVQAVVNYESYTPDAASLETSGSSKNIGTTSDQHQQRTCSIDQRVFPLRSSTSSALGVLGFFEGPNHTSPPQHGGNLFVVNGLIGSLTSDVDALVSECHQLSTKFDDAVMKLGVAVERATLGNDAPFQGASTSPVPTTDDAKGDAHTTNATFKIRLTYVADIEPDRDAPQLAAAKAGYQSLLVTSAMLKRLVLHTIRADLNMLSYDALGMYEAVPGTSQEQRFLVGDVFTAARRRAQIVRGRTAKMSSSTSESTHLSESDEHATTELLHSYASKYVRLFSSSPQIPAIHLSDAFMDVADALEVMWVLEGIQGGYLIPTLVT